ncbi:MAG: hypothetical protein IJW23_00720 [Lentisphaeria bacterium]|nr:hypothetical protein [Lentisphaeria bacterium]
MGRDATSLTNSLYKINDKIAQASKQPLPGVPEVPAQQNIPGVQNAQTAKQELSQERIIEFNRMHHDLEIRVESMLSEYQAEAEVLKIREQELTQTSDLVAKLKKELDEITLPGKEEQEPDRILTKKLRALELMRLETIRLTKKMDASKSNSGTAAEQRASVDLTEIPNSDIMKKGFAFFFPLFLALLFCTVLLGVAFVLAWKVAF